jgi:hypothetical protein
LDVVGVLLVTGVINLAYRVGWSDVWDGRRWREAMGGAFEWKLALVGVVLVVTVAHDWWIGPKATELGQRNPASPQAVRLRKAASWIGRATMLLSIVIVFLSVVVLRGWP